MAKGLASKKGGKLVARKINELYSKAEPKQLEKVTTASGRYEGPTANMVVKHPSPREVREALNHEHKMEKAMRAYDEFIKNQSLANILSKY